MITTARAWTSRQVAVLVGVWFAAALAVAASGALTAFRPPAPQLLIFGLSVAGWIALRRVVPLCAWEEVVDLRAFVLPHVGRLLAGGAFLMYSARGELPASFAVPAGWGDMAVGVTAAALLLWGPPRSPLQLRAYLTWNVIGLADILFVVANAARAGLQNPAAMAPLLRLPLALLPTFLVPIVLVTHAVLFLRLADEGRDSIEPR